MNKINECQKEHDWTDAYYTFVKDEKGVQVSWRTWTSCKKCGLKKEIILGKV